MVYASLLSLARLSDLQQPNLKCEERPFGTSRGLSNPPHATHVYMVQNLVASLHEAIASYKVVCIVYQGEHRSVQNISFLSMASSGQLPSHLLLDQDGRSTRATNIIIQINADRITCSDGMA